MRKIYFNKNIAACFILLFVHLVSAQKVHIETTQTLPGNLIKAKSVFNEAGYTQVASQNNQKIYVSNETPSGEENINDVTLTIELIFNPAEFIPPSSLQVFNEEGFRTSADITGDNSYSVSVPEGIYDIVTCFTNNGTSKHYFVIKEMIEVAGNTTVQVNVVEAANYISAKLYNETGVLLLPGIYNTADQTITGGNATLLIDRLLYFAPNNNLFFISTFAMGYFLSEEDDRWNFYINDVSERYFIVQNMVGVGYEGNNYFVNMATVTGVSGNVTVENNPANYLLHFEKIKPGPMAENSNPPVYAFETATTINGNYHTGWRNWGMTNQNPEEGIKMYIDNSIDGDISDMQVFPSVQEFWEEGGNPILTSGNAIVNGNNNDVLYGSGNTFPAPNSNFQGIFHYGTEGELFKILPFHPKFSFTSNNNSEVIQGDNTPISVITPIIIPQAEINFLEVQYKGRYGERRENDLYYTNIEAKQDGSVFFSGNYLDFLQINPFPSTGMWDIRITNTNAEVDGLTGKNITQITYNGSEGDSAPVLQHLQFRNTNDQVTDRFASAIEGTVRLAAGDFQYNLDAGVFDYVEGNTVEFYYSQYNQNNWTELELTEYPEHFQMPAFGDYYEASLASIENTEPNAWFDVKIICTDAVGNKQEQIISPAFKLNDTMGVEEATKSSFTVYPNPFSDNLNIRLPETIKGSFTFRVTDLTGKTIYSKEQSNKSFSWNGSSLAKGIYILSIENNGKVIAQKVIKK